MSLIELFIIAVGLSMDAFAVSICKGLSMRTMSLKNAVIVGLYFGGFQGLMPLIGYFLGIHFQQAITSYDHWIAFILLGIIGISMIGRLCPEKKSPAMPLWPLAICWFWLLPPALMPWPLALPLHFFR